MVGFLLDRFLTLKSRLQGSKKGSGIIMKVEVKGDEADECEEKPAKISLLRKFDIPVQNLDFGYVAKCKDVREVERILRILRSGEEGHYPDLTTFTENRLRTLDPNSRVLRVEVPVLRPESLDKNEREQIQNELLDWLDQLEENLSGGGDAEPIKEIFTSDEYNVSADEVPIRGTEIRTQAEEEKKPDNEFVKKRNANRIKSWEYEKWDKLDVEAELTKMDVTDMQISEWEKYQKPKIQQEQKYIEKLMKSTDVKRDNRLDKSPLDKVKKPSEPSLYISPSKPSFIEELPVDPSSKETRSPKLFQEVKGKGNSERLRGVRRIKIKIDDVHIPF